MDAEPQFPDDKATVYEVLRWKKTGKLPPRLRKIRIPQFQPRPVTRDRVFAMLHAERRNAERRNPGGV